MLLLDIEIIYNLNTAHALFREIDLELSFFEHMWNGTEAGWKLIQYPHRVFIVEMNFEDVGPTRAEFPVVLEFIRKRPGESDEQLWERLRGCTGIGLGCFAPSAMNRIRQLEQEYSLNLDIYTVEPDDYLVLTPNGDLFGWKTVAEFRRSVVEWMIEARIPIISAQLE